MKNFKWGIASLVIACLFACNAEPEFHIKGKVADGQGKMIYLVASKLQGATLIDSVKISNDGKFSIKASSIESPEFYRLQNKENQIINFVVDSTETINIATNYNNFGGDYTINPTKNNKEIKILTHLQMKLQRQLNDLSTSAQKANLGRFVYQEKMNQLILDYKENIRKNYIFKAPNTLFAYFALMQSANGFTLFNPLNNKKDTKCFAAVATSFTNNYPNSARAKSLKNITLQGLQKMRLAQKQIQRKTAASNKSLKVEEVGIIDIDLKDRQGNSHKLSDLKGKTVLLDFTVYQSNISTAHNFMLRDLYDKYTAKGFEIYQVALDNDIHFWKTVTDKLPWITVHDPSGIYSTHLKMYNVQGLPSLHLINKNSDYVKRITDVKTLEDDIKKSL